MKLLSILLPGILIPAMLRAAAPLPVVNPHFAEVGQQLEEGGDLYLYMNLRPFIDLLAGAIDQGVQAAEAALKEEKPEEAAKVRMVYGLVTSVAGKLGLGEFGDLGVSTRASEPGLFRTRFVLAKRDAQSRGLMWTWGVKNGPGLPGVNRLPEDSVIAMASRPDVAGLWAGVKTLVAGTPAEQPLQQGVAAALQNGIDVEAIVRSIGDEFALAITLDAERTLELPQVGEIPAPGAVVALKLNDTTLPTLLTLMTAGMKDQVSATNIQGVASTVLRAPGMPPFLAPCWTVHQQWLYVAHHPEALARMLDLAQGKGRSLVANEEFRTYAKGMPEQSYAMSFISKRLMKTYMKVINAVVAADATAPAGLDGIMENFSSLYGEQASVLSVGELYDGGIRATTQGPFNYSISFTAVAVLAPAAVGAAFILPVVGLRTVESSDDALIAEPAVEPIPTTEHIEPVIPSHADPLSETLRPEAARTQKADNSPRGKCRQNQELITRAVGDFQADEGRLPKNLGELRAILGPRPVRCPSGGTYTLPRKEGGMVTCNIDGHSD